MLQLYLLEVFIQNIHFSKKLKPYPKPNDLILTVSVGNLVSFEIQLDVFNPDNIEEPTNTVDFNSGKSCLFPAIPEELKAILENNPLLILLSTVGKSLGVIKINWQKQFLAMIHESIKNPGRKSPITIQDKFIIENDRTQEIIGDIVTKIQLTCFGDQIHTNYKVLDPNIAKDKQTILIKSPQGSTMFQCQRYGSLNNAMPDMLPIAPLYQPNTIDNDTNDNEDMQQMNFTFQTSGGQLSWTALLNNPNKNLKFDMNSIATFDIVSIMDRPNEQKFLNLEVQMQDSDNLIFRLQDDGTQQSSEFSEIPNDTYNASDNQITVDKINKSLCKDRNCPAAIKFKEFGIGPLAIGKGLGTIRTHFKPSMKYGISNTYGTFEHYGPYGLLSKEEERNKRKSEGSEPLRLNGGGGIDYGNIQKPFDECKDIMNKFDKLLQDFRKSQSPCGKFRPYSQNIIKNTSKNDVLSTISSKYGRPYCCPIENQLPPIHWDCPEPLPKGICKNPQCPYLPNDIKRLNQVRDGQSRRSNPESQTSCEIGSTGVCDNPSCPYVETRQSPKTSNSCFVGQTTDLCQNPKCPFRDPGALAKVPQELKEFLVCTNPNCPFLRKNTDHQCTSRKFDDYKKPIKTPYRSCIKADENPSPEVEYTSCTRMDTDDDIQFQSCCGKCTNNKPNKKPYRPCIEADENPSPDVEYTSCTRMSTDEDVRLKSCCGKCAKNKPNKKPYRPCIDADENPSQEVEYTSCTRMDSDEDCRLNICCAKYAKNPPTTTTPDKVSRKRIRRKHRRFDYTFGNKYPRVKFGHHQCRPRGSSVPANQGWLWHLYPRKGWRPGAITKTIAERIRQHWMKKGIRMLQIRQFQHGESDDEKIKIEPKPTLQVQKRDGSYYVTLHPLKDPCKVDQNEDPYMHCTPLKFKIIDKHSDDDDSDDTESSSDSDLDLEFTTPAGLIRPERFKKLPNVVHCDTQYNQKDFDGTAKGGKKGKKKKDKNKKKDKKKKKNKKGKNKK